MKKKDLKNLVMAGMVAGALAATGAVNATEGEVVAAGTHGCGGGCGGKNRPTTADAYAPQSQQQIQRPLTQEELNRQQQQQQNPQYRNTQPAPAHCSGGGQCNGKSHP